MGRKKQKHIGTIVFDDGMGHKGEITVPILRDLFSSEKLVKSYNEDPDRYYSFDEIWDMLDFKFNINTVRTAVNFHIKLFENGEERLEIRKKGVVSVKTKKLTPVVKAIINAVREMKGED